MAGGMYPTPLPRDIRPAPFPPPGRPTYPPGPTTPEPPPRSPPPGFDTDGPPTCSPGQFAGCRPPADTPPAAGAATVAPPEAFAAWTAQQRKLKESSKRKPKSKRLNPLAQNLSILQQDYLKPAAERAIDAVKATAQQAAEEGLRYLANIVFRGKGKAVGKAITVASGIVEQRQRAQPKAPPQRANPLVKVQPAKARPIPKAPGKPTKGRTQIGFPTRYAAPVVAPAARGAKSAPLPGQLQPVQVTGKRVLTPVQVTGKRVAVKTAPNPLTRSQTATAPRSATQTRTATRTPTRTATRTATQNPTWTSVIQRLAAATATRAVTRSPAQSLLRTAPLTSVQAQVLTSTQTAVQQLTRTKQKTCECKEERKKERKKKPPRQVCYRGTYRQNARGITYQRKEQVECLQSKSKRASPRTARTRTSFPGLPLSIPGAGIFSPWG